METHIIQVGHIGASIERGRVFSVDGVMATITATCYKGPPLILADISSSTKSKDKENCNESAKDEVQNDNKQSLVYAK